MATNSDKKEYDAIVIGTGQGGKPLSQALAQAGWQTAVIERDSVGGSCINVGCTPTKTMVASARVAYLANRANDYGVEIGEVKVNLEKVRKRKRDIVEEWSSGSKQSLEKSDNLDLFLGDAKFTSPNSVTVRMNSGGERHISASKIFINTGTRPAAPSIEGLDRVQALDNASIMELGEAPEHLLALGGGYISLEFGQMFRRFGSEVTIIQRGPQLLAREDSDVAEEVAKILREDGIEVMLNADAVRVTKKNGGAVELTVRTPDGERPLEGSHLLVAVGRTPNSDSLNLKAAGIETDKHGFISNNERLETSVPGVYALGDVKGGPAFTHISYDDFRIIRANLLENGDVNIKGRLVPYTVFIDPQLGRVGMSEKEARANSLNIFVAKLPMSHVARAIETEETRGFMKAVVDADTGLILGCAVLGIEGGEVMSVLQMAMMGGVPYTTIKEAVFAHPTLAESLNNLFMTLDK